MRSKLWALLYLFISTSLLAQEFTTDQYYLFPINPGKQNFLAGTMGELRSSHFHAGLDIKTGGQSGVPVRATADGFISRIKVNSGGYGFALYMTHPNGTTSVYAHMKEFAQPIKDFEVECGCGQVSNVRHKRIWQSQNDFSLLIPDANQA